jgi:hypothetical protein
MQSISTIGLDIAKSVFQVHAVDAAGQVVLRRQLRRRHVLAFFQKLPPCLVGIEACASSHHWSRELQALGHTVRLMPPAYVQPYVKRQKNDTTDAEAICEAVTRPSMRFVPTKTVEQQSCLMLHRARHLFIRQQTAVINSIRAYLAEFGIVAPVGRRGVEHLLDVVADKADRRLPEVEWQQAHQARKVGFWPRSCRTGMSAPRLLSGEERPSSDIAFAAFPKCPSGRHPHSNFRDLLRLHFCYGPSDRSAAQGRLRRRASTQPVTWPSRLPASGPIDIESKVFGPNSSPFELDQGRLGREAQHFRYLISRRKLSRFASGEAELFLRCGI